MTDWTTAQVQDRLELAAGVMRQMPGVMPQGFFNAWPEYFHSFADKVGQEPQMRRPRPEPAPDHGGRGGDALAALAREGRCSARLAARRWHAVEADLLGARDQPGNGEPALAVRHRGDHLAAERSRAVAPTSQQFVIENANRLSRKIVL